MGDGKINDELHFTIVSGDDTLIKEIVSRYNEIYGTDFIVESFIYDEVTLANLKVSNYQMFDVFNLGSQFGSTALLKRQKGEIRW